MAAQSNINVAREFIQANKQALADMGVAAKELDKIFKSLEDGLDKQDKLNKDQLETYKKSIEFARERAAAENEVTKQKKKQKKEETALDKQIQNSVNSINEKYNKSHKFLRNIPGIGRALSGVLDNFGPYIDQYNEFFEKSLRKAAGDSTDEIAKTGSQKLGAAGRVGGTLLGAGIVAFGKKAFDTMTELGLDMGQTVGLGFQVFFGEQLKAVTEEFGSINDSSTKLVGKMKLFSFLTGTSADDLAKTVGLMAATTNLSNEQVLAQINVTKQMAQQAGIPIKGIMADVAGNAEFFAKFSKDGGQNILNAALQAKKLGINLGDVASITNSLLDFETSIEKQMEAQVLLGRNINVDRARQLAFMGDNVGLMTEVTRLAGSEAEFNRMNYFEREALAGALGLTVERMSKLIRQEAQAEATTGSWFNKTIGIAAALGGALGMLIGGLSGGVGFARMAGFGIGGVALGASIGTLAKGIVPGLAEGGIVNSPMLAMVGERGREAVTPLGAQGVEVDMRETNTLLRALLGSSEKQVNRLGDIGTS